MAAPIRARAMFETYTHDMSGEDLDGCSLTTPATPTTSSVAASTKTRFASLPWWKRLPLKFREVFFAFTLKLSPAGARFISARS